MPFGWWCTVLSDILYGSNFVKMTRYSFPRRAGESRDCYWINNMVVGCNKASSPYRDGVIVVIE